MVDRFLLSDDSSHQNISSSGWKKWLGEPIHKELIGNVGFN